MTEEELTKGIEELEKKLNAALKGLGIKPDAHEYYHREQFVRAWEIVQWDPDITDDDRRDLQPAVEVSKRIPDMLRWRAPGW